MNDSNINRNINFNGMNVNILEDWQAPPIGPPPPYRKEEVPPVLLNELPPPYSSKRFPHLYPSAETAQVLDSIHCLSEEPLKTKPVERFCPNCRKFTETKVTKRLTSLAANLSILICIAGCFCGCCLIPLQINSLKSFEHSCPNCNLLFGSVTGGDNPPEDS